MVAVEKAAVVVAKVVVGEARAAEEAGDKVVAVAGRAALAIRPEVDGQTLQQGESNKVPLIEMGRALEVRRPSLFLAQTKRVSGSVEAERYKGPSPKSLNTYN